MTGGVRVVYLWLALCCISSTLAYATSGTLNRKFSDVTRVRRLQRTMSTVSSKASPIPVTVLRGGNTFLNEHTKTVVGLLPSSPLQLFNSALAALAGSAFLWKLWEGRSQLVEAKATKPRVVRSLQVRYLAVFWLIRMADWLQGPYFYEVYHSKVFNGVPASMDLVSKIFLTGFAVTGAFGPQVGKLVDRFGRKKGTLAFVLLYILSALSTRSNQLWVVLLGRIAAGLGTSLLFSAPEAWLVSEHERSKVDGKWLGETFGWAYTGDSLVAILAGQLAGQAARLGGPTGPFLLSIGFLLSGAAVALLQWGENTAGVSAKSASLPGPGEGKTTSDSLPNITEVSASSPSVQERLTAGEGEAEKAQLTVGRTDNALQAMLADRKILLLGAVQALFEGAMYIFVLQWPPLMKRAVQASSFGSSAAVPYGSIFSCLMASCLVGSTAFSALQKRGVAVEKSAPFMLLTAAVAMISVTQLKTRSLLGLSAAMFLFEACVGMYFPTIGTLRSKYLPDQYRSVIMNFFGIPLNLIVISVVLSSKLLGVDGALNVASGALTVAAASMFLLRNASGASELKPQLLPM